MSEGASPPRAWDRLRALFRSGLARASVGFVFGAMLQRAVPLLLLPVLTRHLAPAEYGQVAMFTLAVNLLEPLAGLSSVGSLSRQFFDRSGAAFETFVANCLYLLVWSAAGLAALALLGAPAMGRAMGLPAAWIWVALAIAVGKYVVNVRLTLWQLEGRPWPYTALLLLQSISALGLSVLLVLGAGWGWTGRAVGELVGVLLAAAVSAAYLRGPMRRPPIDREALRTASRFGIGLLPHLYGGLMLASADRFVLQRLTGLEQVGLYAVAVQLTSLITVLASAVNTAWIPWLFERYKRNTPRDRQRVTQLVTVHDVLLLALALLLAFVARPVLAVVVGPEFQGAAPFVLVLALGAAAGGMYNMAVNPIFYSGRTYLVPIATVGAGVVNVGLNLLLIPVLGPLGAALAFAVASLASYLLASVLARNVLTPPPLAAGLP